MGRDHGHRTRVLSRPRRLDPVETEILNRLLSLSFPGSLALRYQVAQTEVAEICEDCPTLFLVVDTERAAPAEVVRRVPVEGEAADSDGVRVHLLLHVVDGYLSELEVYRDDSDQVRQIPTAEVLEVFSPDELKPNP